MNSLQFLHEQERISLSYSMLFETTRSFFSVVCRHICNLSFAYACNFQGKKVLQGKKLRSMSKNRSLTEVTPSIVVDDFDSL